MGYKTDVLSGVSTNSLPSHRYAELPKRGISPWERWRVNEPERAITDDLSGILTKKKQLIKNGTKNRASL